MKRTFYAGFVGLSLMGAAHGQGLYYTDSEAQDSLPLKWSVGLTFTYDDNVNPTASPLLPGYEEDASSLNPYVGVSFLSVTPQTTLDVYARLGLIYYLDQPSALGSEDTYTQARLGANITHRVNERLRFSSRNFLAYELEPDYSYGFANSRQAGEYFYWETDNSVGYRWTERLATYSGFTLSGLAYDSSVPNSDRFTWALHHQFRYQTSPRSVLTAEYRYSDTTGDGLSSDATDQFILVGVEYRFNPNTILSAKAGAQIHEVDTLGGSDTTNPYVEVGLNSQINTQFGIRAFARYSNENYDTIRSVFGAGDLYEFTSRETLRIGVNGTYQLTPKLGLFGGVDYLPASFDDGIKRAGPGPAGVSGLEEDIISAFIGLSVKFNDMLSGDISYTHTNADSDLFANTYDRNRVSVGVRAEF